MAATTARATATAETEERSLNMREIADRDLKDILPKPTELIGEFRDEHEFENLIRNIDKGMAYSAKTQCRESMKETYYWHII